MGHFELNAACKNTQRHEKPRKRVESAKLSLVSQESKNHMISVTLVSDIKANKDLLYYLEKTNHLGFKIALPFACLLSVLAITLIVAKNTLNFS